VGENAAGESNRSNEATAVPGVPLAPTELAATAYEHLVVVRWDAVPGATGYNVKRGASAGGPYDTIVANTAETWIYDEETTEGMRWYVVSALNACGEGPDSAPVGILFGRPPAPVNLIARGTDQVIHLQWDPVEGATGYHLYRSDDDGGSYWRLGYDLKDPRFTDDYYLTYGKYYWYYVTALNGPDLESDPSGTVGEMLWAQTQPPTAPVVTAVPGHREVLLTWSGGYAQYFTVRRAGAPGGPFETVADFIVRNSYRDAGLGGGTYYYIVRAVNNVGSADSAVVSATPTGPPGPPGNLSALGSDRRVLLSWSPSPGALGYKVKRSGLPGGPYGGIAVGVMGSTFEDVSVSNGSRYYYVVSAYNAEGESPDSLEVSALPNAPPAPPTGVVASGGNGFVLLTWIASAGATSYDVGRSTVAGGPYTPIATSLTSPSYTDTGLANGTRYYYVVEAVNSAGRLGRSEEVSTIPTSPPGAPWGLSAVAGDSRVELTWSGVAEATGYRVMRREDQGGTEYSPIASVSGTVYADGTVTNGTTYGYVVTAFNGAGESGPSNEVTATPGALPPEPPRNVRTLSYGGAVDVLWDPSPSPRVAGYRVYRPNYS